jgi:hypothetical protein
MERSAEVTKIDFAADARDRRSRSPQGQLELENQRSAAEGSIGGWETEAGLSLGTTRRRRAPEKGISWVAFGGGASDLFA